MHITAVHLLHERYPTREYHPYNLPLFQESEGIALDNPVTFFVGENGTGKSTLLEAIATRCGIYIWRGMRRTRAQFNKYERSLHLCLKVDWVDDPVPGTFFASQIFQNFTTLLDEWAAGDPGLLDFYGGKSLLNQSHGQSLMSFFRSCFAIKGIFLLDEPETALSPRTQLELLRLVQEMSLAGHAQFIIATHSPILMACPHATIYSFDDVPFRPVDYRQTPHYKIYRDFMRDPNGFLNDPQPQIGKDGES